MIHIADLLTKYWPLCSGWSVVGAAGLPLADQLDLVEWPETVGTRKPTIAEVELKASEYEEFIQFKTLGFHVLPEDFYLDTSVESQNAFTSYVSTLTILKQAPNQAVVPIHDKQGNVHQLTFGRLKEILSDYADHILAQRGF